VRYVGSRACEASIRAHWAVLILALAGCNAFEPCQTDIHPAVAVEVREAGTGVSLAEGARGVLREGAFVDSLRLWKMPAQLGGAFERPGTYSVEVEHAGYVKWQRDGVRARDSSCHVRTVTLRADLVPLP